MIGSLNGKVAYIGTSYCLLETTGGVGYRVFMPSSQLTQLTLGEVLYVLIYTVVREDAILLYGFLKRDEYELFTLLLTVSGVGPKGASSILSSIKPDAFCLAVQSRDLKALTKLPGIGKKTAERMILELKDKIGTGADGEDAALVEALSENKSTSVNETVEVLVSLGYTNGEIWNVLKKIPDYDRLSAEELTRKALKLFGGRK